MRSGVLPSANVGITAQSAAGACDTAVVWLHAAEINTAAKIVMKADGRALEEWQRMVALYERSSFVLPAGGLLSVVV